MPELKFSGVATLTGFPSDKPFSFDIEPNKLTIRAGKEVFAVIERETPAVLQLPNGETLGVGSRVPAGPYNGYDTVKVAAAEILSPAKFTQDEAAALNQQPATGKSYDGTLESLIVIDPTIKANYRTIRAKYFETLKTANGREVGWWANSAMVKALEGDPMRMLQFFITEGVVRIDKRGEKAAAEGSPVAFSGATPAQQISPSFAMGSPLPSATGQPASAAAGWTPPANFGNFK